MPFATLVEKKQRGVRDDKVHMNQLENCQARYRSYTWMGRTRNDGPDEFEPSKIDCIMKIQFKDGQMTKSLISIIFSTKT